MNYLNKAVLTGLTMATISLLLFLGFSYYHHEPNWHIKKSAIASESHPLAGFWKEDNCEDPWGWAIGPVSPDLYYVTFCGPGGCSEKGISRPNSTIVNDPDYQVLNTDTILFLSKSEWVTQVRCYN